LREVLAEVSGQRELVEGLFARHVYDASRVSDRVVSLHSQEVLPQPGLVQFKGRQVELTATDVDKAVADHREAWKKAHPDAKDGVGAFPYRTQVVLRREGAAVPQTVRVDFADGSHQLRRLQGNDDWARFEFLTPARAVSARIDDANAIF